MRIDSLILKKVITKDLAFFVLLSFVAIFAPFFNLQAVTGPLVNATLFLATIFLGVKSAVFFAIFPSIIALAIGLLPLPLAPFIPFIVTGNIILVLVFNRIQDNYWLGVVLSSFLKFAFLFLISYAVSNFIFSPVATKILVNLMSWPQFATALTGGLIAYFFINLFKKTNV